MNENITLHHLINDDRFLAWSCSRKEDHFKDLWQNNGGLIKEPYFIWLARYLSRMGYRPPARVMIEWRQMAQMTEAIHYCPPLFLTYECYKGYHWESFHLMMMTITCHYQQQRLILDIAKCRSRKQRPFMLLKLMKSLEQWMLDLREKDEKECISKLKKAYALILAYHWMWIHHHFAMYLLKKSLCHSHQEILALLEESTESHAPLEAYRQGLLQATHDFSSTKNKETSPPLPYEEIKSRPLFMLLQEVRIEMKSLKKGLQSLMEAPQTSLKKKKDYLKPGEAASLLGITTTTLAEWRQKGKLKQYRKLSNRYEYQYEEIASLIYQSNLKLNPYEKSHRKKRKREKP